MPEPHYSAAWNRYKETAIYKMLMKLLMANGFNEDHAHNIIKTSFEAGYDSKDPKQFTNLKKRVP